MTKKSTMTTPSKETPIDDLSLCAFLKTIGYPILRIDESPRGLKFIFSDVPDSAIAGYFADTWEVPPKTYGDNIKYIKGIILEWKRKNDIAPRGGGWR